MNRANACLWCFGLFGSLLFPTLASGQSVADTLTRIWVADSVSDRVILEDYLMYLPAEVPQGSLAEVRAHDHAFVLMEEDKLPEELRSSWVRVQVTSALPRHQEWMLYLSFADYIDVYILRPGASVVHKQSGYLTPSRDKDVRRGRAQKVRLELAPGETARIYIHYRNKRADSVNPTSLSLLDFRYWLTLSDEEQNVILALFEGIVLIMLFYNLIIFFTLRSHTYLHYAGYLFCVALFVLYAVGPLYQPPFGDPLIHQHISFLSFSGISIFYFLFGRSFLESWILTPRWDRFLHYYIIFKIGQMLVVQVILAFTFDLSLCLLIDFAIILLDAVISVLFFVALIRSGSVLARFFVAGSTSVLVVGFTYAVLGSVLDLQNSFLIFLISIVVEILIFSLGLGYRMRMTERAQLAAEREQREAQEALNRELSKINTAFGRFVPHEFLRSLGHDSILDVRLGDQVEKEVTVLFSDIRDYTSMAEHLSPKENFEFLNAYLGRMGPIIQKHHGFVNQYYGDGIMALFLDTAEDALKAAIEMQQAVRIYNQERYQKKREALRVGIGLHRGSLIMGVIGDTLRLEAGVVADTVNTASRMEGLTKYYGTSIIASGSVMESISDADRYAYRFLGQVLVKGRTEPQKIYECFDGDPDSIRSRKMKTLPDFRAGLGAYYEKAFSEAAHAFDRVLAADPADQVARRYLEQTRELIVSGVPADWTGVRTMLEK